jgi:hypothetical protein
MTIITTKYVAFKAMSLFPNPLAYDSSRLARLGNFRHIGLDSSARFGALSAFLSELFQ